MATSNSAHLQKTTSSTWLWKMAWRDSRNHRRRLLLFVSAIAIGIAAVVAIQSFGQNLEQSINDQAQTLLGADLVIRSRQPFLSATEILIDSISGEQARLIKFSSMALFPKSDDMRLVQVRALEGEFPFYGRIETRPQIASQAFKTGPHALVDEGLMLQFNAQPGDSIKLGAMTFRIAGALMKIPGEAAVGAIISPRVYIPMAWLAETELLQFGSRASYSVFFKLGNGKDAESLVQKVKPYLDQNHLSFDTVEERKERLGKTLSNLYTFLSMVGFISLLLGGIGVASSIHVYIKQKIRNIAVLRCLGVTSKQAFQVYLIQTSIMGLIGAALGAAIGTLIQIIMPEIFSNFIPVATKSTISWIAIFQGIAIGLGITILFSLLPLLSIRKISPLMALRSFFEEFSSFRKDPLQWLILGLISLGVAGLILFQTEDKSHGFIFLVSVSLAFSILTGLAKLIMFIVKRFLPKSLSYVYRQSLANLYRPNNQTLMLMLSLGLGTFLIGALYLTQNTLLNQVSLTSRGDRPNLVLFDIQTDQKQSLQNLVDSFNIPVLQDVPIVTMRLTEIKNKSIATILNDSSSTIPRWALVREYRSTYRDSMINTESLFKGEWRGTVNMPSDSIFISLEKDIASNLNVRVGDQLTFDIQGFPFVTFVSSIREVDWQRVQPNFFIVFPVGILENAPQFHVLVTRVSSKELSAKFQQAVVQAFPNISAIDLTLILNSVDEILDKIAFVIRFIALFSIATGLLVLIGSVMTSRYQRMTESTLLRTMGASRTQIFKILALEYFFIGGFAAFIGILLAQIGSWVFSYLVFETIFLPALTPIFLIVLIVTSLTMAIGIFNSRSVVNRPPLEVLRAEV